MYLANEFHARSESANRLKIASDKMLSNEPLEIKVQKCVSNGQVENAEEEMKMP